LLSPFNTLPLGPGLGDTIRTAVIVSNIAPFAPEIWGAFGLYQRTRLRLLRALTTRSLHRADLIFLLSAEAEQRLEAFAQTGKIVRIPMAPPNPALVEEARRIRLPKKIEDRPFFFVAGDLLPYKQFEEAIQAACIVGDRQVRLLISGTSLDAVYAHRLRRLARGSPGKIAFLGAQPHVRTLAYMHRAVATLVCSRLENPSRIPTEAMAMGCPVIAADTPNYREGCGDAAVYYTPGDFRALAHAMHALLEERTRDKLRDHGRRRVASMDWLDASRAILRAMNLLPRPDVGGTTKSP
jgi:glycosyltransferase involved in cell wall biosynthesis